ncbi:hypothetical protein ALC56_11766, partial [Trachymyrmex septentrionalis]
QLYSDTIVSTIIPARSDRVSVKNLRKVEAIVRNRASGIVEQHRFARLHESATEPRFHEGATEVARGDRRRN